VNIAGVPFAFQAGNYRRLGTLRAIKRGQYPRSLITQRQAGVERVSETRLIALEPSGKITVLKAS
jgi:hypothetical protein